jgi:hypothetical protein
MNSKRERCHFFASFRHFFSALLWLTMVSIVLSANVGDVSHRHPEAIVYVTKELDPCRSQRILSLSVASGGRDVIVLYDSGFVPSNENIAISLCNNITQGNIYFVPQPIVSGCLKKFRMGSRSGDSKASALKWLGTSSYLAMWHIEDDV